MLAIVGCVGRIKWGVAPVGQRFFIMASGRTHETINVATLLGVGVAFAVLSDHPGFDPPLGEVVGIPSRYVFAVAYLIGTFLITPDLDLAEGHVRAKKHWGLLGFLWVPYGWLFTHRGISHTWFAGPLTRLIYLALLVGVFAAVLAPLRPVVEDAFSMSLAFSIPWGQIAPAALAGYVLSQWMHLIADGIWPGR